MAEGSIAHFPMDGQWRVTALLKRLSGIGEATFAGRLVTDLVPAMTVASPR
jgi:hypothetical protein